MTRMSSERCVFVCESSSSASRLCNNSWHACVLMKWDFAYVTTGMCLIVNRRRIAPGTACGVSTCLLCVFTQLNDKHSPFLTIVFTQPSAITLIWYEQVGFLVSPSILLQMQISINITLAYMDFIRLGLSRSFKYSIPHLKAGPGCL